jgi:ribonuclease HII
MAIKDSYSYEIEGLAGVDEVGRGPIAGPVFAAAVILDKKRPIAGLRDSKKLSEKQRHLLSAQIKRYALAWSIASSTEKEIDAINILQASLLAMQRAVAGLKIVVNHVVVDGIHKPRLALPCDAIVRGDNFIAAISAAAIIAKQARDAFMREQDSLYPGYFFAKNKGYPTKQHIAALQILGPCAIHRTTFTPVKNLINQSRHLA